MCCDPYAACIVQSYWKPTTAPCSYGWKSMWCATCTPYLQSEIAVGCARLASAIEIVVARI